MTSRDSRINPSDFYPDYNVFTRVSSFSCCPSQLFAEKHDSNGEILEIYQIVVSALLIPAIIQMFYDSHMRGHGCIQETLDIVCEHHLFHRISPIVTDHVQFGSACQKTQDNHI